MIEIICSGYGGQGVLVTGLILADAAMELDQKVTWFPSYGAEMRGGTANCHVKISNDEIASPYVSKIDTLIAMNEASIAKFQSRIKSGGLLVYNGSLANDECIVRNDIEVVKVQATDIAQKCSNPKGLNIVMLGAFSKYNTIFDADYLNGAIENFFSKKGKKYPKNTKCFYEGRNLAEKVY
jgi:2-oxoglutarate ferredoxin oxidoreductase subunit gamma